MTSSECTRCGRKCVVGLTHHVQHPHTKAWIRWRHCVPCAKAEEDLQDERAQEAIREAERSGV